MHLHCRPISLSALTHLLLQHAFCTDRRFTGDFFISPDETDIDEWKRVLATIGTPVEPSVAAVNGDDDETYGEN